MSYSTVELAVDAPEWLNAEFFEGVLSKHKNDGSIKVTNIKVTPGALKGDHYASVMYRVKVDYTVKELTDSESISLILKTLPHQDCTKKDLLGELFLFETEIRMYSETMPKFEKHLRKAGDDIPLGARAIYHSFVPCQLIIFEDLVEKGYDLLRDRRLRKQETKAVLAKVAKWHAASYVLHHQDDKTISDYSQSLFSMMELIKSSFLSDGVNGFMRMLSQTEDLKSYYKKFEALKSSLVERCTASTQAYFKRKDDALFVLNHGDLHIKNVMFKLQPDPDMSDIKLVDFQLSFFGPAVYDIILLLYGIADSETRINHRDEVIYSYFEHFIDHLSKMGFQGELPKLVNLKIDLLRHRHLEVFFFVTFIPMIVAGENLAEMDSTAAVENADYRRNFYFDKTYIDEARVVLPMFLHQGYLD